MEMGLPPEAEEALREQVRTGSVLMSFYNPNDGRGLTFLVSDLPVEPEKEDRVVQGIASFARMIHHALCSGHTPEWILEQLGSFSKQSGVPMPTIQRGGAADRRGSN